MKQTLYQAAKSIVNAMPPWLLRLRPFDIYELDLSQTITEVKPAISIDIRWIQTPEELLECANIAASINLKQWNGHTRRAAVAWQDAKPVGIAWINTKSFEEPDLGLRYELTEEEAWLHSAHVLVDVRRQGIYHALLRFVTKALTDEGQQRILLGVTHGNKSSKAAHQRAGTMKLGSIFAIRMLGIACCLIRGKIQPSGLHFGKQITMSVQQ